MNKLIELLALVMHALPYLIIENNYHYTHFPEAGAEA